MGDTKMSEGPLAGLRVVELAGTGPGPHAAMLLADLGADVVRVERPAATPSPGGMPDWVLRGRRSVTADLKEPAGLELVLRLAGRADVLIEGFRPGVAERPGVGPDRCLELNPRLVYARMTGWGQHGPLAARAGHDINYISLTGMLHAIGPAVGPRGGAWSPWAGLSRPGWRRGSPGAFPPSPAIRRSQARTSKRCFATGVSTEEKSRREAEAAHGGIAAERIRRGHCPYLAR
jgi:hypothetical protein